ncbi:MAG TPA: 2-hydroxymuconate tautomerase [Baekduia sp.]|nr:2-hydroxymuconate tautomerase [Baekduia sp.]
MPLVQISFIEGPTAEQQRELITDVTKAVIDDFGVPAEAVQVVLTSVPTSSWAVGGTPLSELHAS